MRLKVKVLRLSYPYRCWVLQAKQHPFRISWQQSKHGYGLLVTSGAGVLGLAACAVRVSSCSAVPIMSGVGVIVSEACAVAVWAMAVAVPLLMLSLILEITRVVA